MWRPPRDQLDVDAYEVRYFARGGSRNASSQVLITKKESITISGLRDRTNYGFEIRTQTASQGMYGNRISFLVVFSLELFPPLNTFSAANRPNLKNS